MPIEFDFADELNLDFTASSSTASNSIAPNSIAPTPNSRINPDSNPFHITPLKQTILQKPPECFRCPVNHLTQGFSRLEGSGRNRVLVVAEALGEHEMLDGLPLRPQAPSGSTFQTTLDRGGMVRNDFGITNVMRCRPPNNSLEQLPGGGKEALEYCSEIHLRRAIEQLQPKFIVALGATALKRFCDLGEGTKRSITHVRGFVLNNTWFPEIPVIATYHPSYIQRDKPNLLMVFRTDISRAVRFAKNGWTRRTLQWEVPTPEDFQRFVSMCLEPDRLRLPLTYDIETEMSQSADESEIFGLDDGRVMIVQPMDGEAADNPDVLRATAGEDVRDSEGDAIQLKTEIHAHQEITQIQFTIGIPGVTPSRTVVVPWDFAYVKEIQRLMAAGHRKAGWNSWGFDDKLLRVHGCELGGELHDLMWMWHRYQPDLPRGLQFGASCFLPEGEPWKHLAGRHTTRGVDDFYGAKDVFEPATFWPMLESELKRAGAWRSYDRHARRLDIVLRSMSKRGIPVNDQRRMELGREVEISRDQAFLEIQELVPDCLKKIEPKPAGYGNDKIAEKLGAKEGEAVVKSEKQSEDNFQPGQKWVRREFEVEVKVRVGKEPKPKEPKPRVPKGASKASRKRKAAAETSEMGDSVRLESTPDDTGSENQGCDADANESGHARGESSPKETVDSEGSVEVPDADGRSGGSDQACVAHDSGMPDATGSDAGKVSEGERVMVQVIRWARLQPFLPNSPQQIQAYIQYRRDEEIREKVVGYRKQKRYENAQEKYLVEMAARNAVYRIPIDRKTRRPTTAKKELDRLGKVTKDPFFRRCVDYREFVKIKSTYVDGWRPHPATKRVHPEFGYAPATGQKSCRGPNAQNTPK
jgi:uracil-DNA glycosylase family 4